MRAHVGYIWMTGRVGFTLGGCACVAGTLRGGAAGFGTLGGSDRRKFDLENKSKSHQIMICKSKLQV